MSLSYSLRLLCLVIVSAGLLQIGLELLFWICAPLLLRLLSSLPVRQRERSLYMVHLAPFVLALLSTFFLCVPEYVSNETNLAPEKVGWLCVLLAISVSIWWGFGAFAGLRIAVRTRRFTRACEYDGQPFVSAPGQTPIFTFPGTTHWLALVGLVRPFIFMSRSLIEEEGLNPLALEVVLDHERSHAKHLDNWKLLSLHCLPQLGLRLPGGSTWMELWQNTAEWAADDDAVRGDSTRAFVLAETLVAFGRHAAARSQIVSTALVCREAELVLRVERLIHREPGSYAQCRHSMTIALWSAICAAGIFLAVLVPWLHNLPEQLLHLK
jgi:hypothetical protein